ncbi:MAG: hypothetical protein V3W20_01850, partial [Candidatus Neomarinimicrobiota bacterium]
FYFSQRFDIVDKESNAGDTGNSYLVNVPADESIQLSYENDIAPFAKHAAEVSGIVGLANIREKTRFPFNFEKFCPININNVNNKNFVDAIVQVRLYDSNNSGTLDYYGNQVDYIDDLDLTYYDDTGADGMLNLDLIRIYDDDKTTPIKVTYVKYTGTAFIDIYVKIPLFVAGQLKTLYLCFNTPTGEEEGVNITDYKTYEYGEFAQLESNIVPLFFNVERVKSNQTVICSPMDYLRKSDEVLNLADDNNPGEIRALAEWTDTQTKQLFTGESIGSGSVLLHSNLLSGVVYEELPFTEIPDRITMWARIKLTDLTDADERVIFLFKKDSSFKGLYLGLAKEDDEYKFALMTTSLEFLSWDVEKLRFNETMAVQDGDEVFVCLSIDRDESVSLFLGDLLTGGWSYQKLAWDNWTEEPDDEFFDDVEYFSMGFEYSAGVAPEDFSIELSQFQMIINKYYDAENDDDITAIYNIANFMPSFENAIGVKIITEE